MPRKKKVVFRAPKSVRVLGVDYKVMLADVAGESGRIAEVRFWKKTIRLDHDNPQPESVVHELVHLVDEKLKIGLDEDGTERMEAGLVALIGDNPALFRHLADVLERKP